MNKNIKSISEFQLIDSLMNEIKSETSTGVLGVGDDCAVVTADALFKTLSDNLVFTSDTLVEGKHFRLDFSSAFDIGWKLAAVNISDVASMGAYPRAALISLGAPANTEFDYLKELYRGINSLFMQHQILLLGGDTVCTNELVLTMTMIGVSSQTPIKRSGAKLGDDLWVSGEIGSAQIGLQLLSGIIDLDSINGSSKFIECHRRPEPRVKLGISLSEQNLVTAMIDVSDGLLADAEHLAEQSKVTLEIELAMVPVGIKDFSDSLTLKQLVTGGDDYELLFTASVGNRDKIQSMANSSGIPNISRIGRIVSSDKSEVNILERNLSVSLTEYLAGSSSGYKHFGE